LSCGHLFHDEINRLEDIVAGFLEFAPPSSPTLRSRKPTMEAKSSILVIEDDPGVAGRLKKGLR
jgi:hypothetical protein